MKTYILFSGIGIERNEFAVLIEKPSHSVAILEIFAAFGAF